MAGTASNPSLGWLTLSWSPHPPSHSNRRPHECQRRKQQRQSMPLRIGSIQILFVMLMVHSMVLVLSPSRLDRFFWRAWGFQPRVIQSTTRVSEQSSKFRSSLSRSHPSHYYYHHHHQRQRPSHWFQSLDDSSLASSSQPQNTSTTTRTTNSPTLQQHDDHPKDIALNSLVLGPLYPIRLPGQEDEPQSFVQAMGVPTYAAATRQDYKNTVTLPLVSPTTTTRKSRGLEGVLGDDHGPALVVDNILSEPACRQLVHELETHRSTVMGRYQTTKNKHGALQVVVPQSIADAVAQALAPFLNVQAVQDRRTEFVRASLLDQNTSAVLDNEDDDDDVRLGFVGLNRRWRIYRYEPGGQESFAPHIDAGFPPSGLSKDGTELVWDTNQDDKSSEIVSRLTILMYLNDDFVGGETKFYQPRRYPRQTFVSSGESNNHNDYDDYTVIASVRPKTGSVLIFPQAVGEAAVDYARQQWPLHEGSPVLSGPSPKYVIRSDALFVTQRHETLDKTDPDFPLFQYDAVVRNTFLPPPSNQMIWNVPWLSHVRDLYNPHMGVEHVGPLLYSLIRMAKKRQVLEIGAGYTTLWILQALADNDEEWRRIHALQQQGQCRLLDYEWTVPSIVNQYFDSADVPADIRADDDELDADTKNPRMGNPANVDAAVVAPQPARLWCIDNCLHQKETATGAQAVAKALGLESYLEFRAGNAFDLRTRAVPEQWLDDAKERNEHQDDHTTVWLEPNSLDVVWCDFGVGTRLAEFVSYTWPSLRPGGWLLCHSTLTNTNTRSWLEIIRQGKQRQSQNKDLDNETFYNLTGIPSPDDYVELSLLEPHKRFQNSLTLLQKRRGTMTNATNSSSSSFAYAEPIYSQYA